MSRIPAPSAPSEFALRDVRSRRPGTRTAAASRRRWSVAELRAAAVVRPAAARPR